MGEIFNENLIQIIPKKLDPKQHNQEKNPTFPSIYNPVLYSRMTITAKTDDIPIDTVILDIEGTVCPITFVKDTLFPYFIEKLPSILDKFQYPLSNTSASSDDQVLNILKQLPDNITKSSESIYKHFKNLVDQDIKDPILKSLQGLIWKQGYENNELQAPIYQDSIEFIESFPTKVVLITKFIFIHLVQ